MESSSSTASAFPVNSLALALTIRHEDNEIEHNSPTPLRVVPPSASNRAAQEMLVEGAFKCKLCPRTFKTARALGGHQKAHSPLYAHKKNKKVNKGRRRRSVWTLTRFGPCSYATALRSACLRAQPFGEWHSHYDPSVGLVPLALPWQTGTGTSSLVAVPAAGGTGDGGRLLCLQDVREGSQEKLADRIDLTLKL